MNAIITKRQAYKNQYTSNRRATFNQIKAQGGTVKKGEKGTPIYRYIIGEKKEKDKDGKPQTYSSLLMFRVWNIDQTEGATRKDEETENHANETRNDGEAIINEYITREGINTREGEPSYTPLFDSVAMPPITAFETAEQYYLTYYHEIIHSTGHSKRLKRLETNNVLSDKDSYSKEELTAEFGACLIYETTGKDFDLTNSATYLASRAKQIKTDNKQAELIQAIGKAEKAKQYVLDINKTN
jgi:antirestriction protein ArdC